MVSVCSTGCWERNDVSRRIASVALGHLIEGRQCSPLRLWLLCLVAMLKAAMRASMRSGSKKMTEVVRESRCNGID